MKQKPWAIVVLSVLHWVSPLGNILLNSWQTRVSILSYIAALLSAHNFHHFLFIVILPVLAGSCIFSCRKWSYLVYIGLMVLPFFYSLYNAHGIFQAGHVLFIVLLYTVNIAVVGYFLLPNIRNIYLNPKIRWWQLNPRFESDFATTIQATEDTAAFSGKIRNISVGGFYIETDATLALQKNCRIQFCHNENLITVSAQPVFHRKSHPQGFGFKVEREDSRKAELRKVVRQLKLSGAILKSRVPGPQESFKNWLKVAVKNPRHWVPNGQ